MNRQAVIKDQESKPTYKEAIPVLQKQDTVEQYSKEVIKNIDSSKFEEDSNNPKFGHYSKILTARYISLELTDRILYDMVE